MAGGFSFEDGVLGSLLGRDDNRARYTFSGDMSQMNQIYRVLSSVGFTLVHNDVRPGFQEGQEDKFKEALAYLYRNRVNGWWSQESALVQYGICTQAEYDTARGRTPRPSH